MPPKMPNNHKMPDGSKMENGKHPKSSGLSAKQKANLPVALQKAILAKKK